MSELAAGPLRTVTGPVRPPGVLSRIRRAGYVLLGGQLLGFLLWSTIVYRRYALTFDFAFYHQAWFLIAHGDIDPHSTVEALQYWRSDSEFLLWPLAPLYWIWPHGLILLWLQDLCVVGAETVAFRWLCELAASNRRDREAAWLAGCGLVLLLANPWTWWSVAWDFHEEAVAVLFAALLAYDLVHGRRRAWIWVVPILAAGAPSATYVAGIGLAGVLAGRRSRAAGGTMVCAAVGYSVFVALVHGTQGVPFTHVYGYLATGTTPRELKASISMADLVAGIAAHPLRVLQTFWIKHTDLVANLAPAGLFGLGFVPLLPLMLVVTAANTLFPGYPFAGPCFQSLPVYVLLPAGTVGVLSWLARRHRRVALLLAGLAAVQALGWLAVWGPGTAGHWLRVTAPAAATLASIESRIPGSAEVVASQGIAGRFSGRAEVVTVIGPGTVPIAGGETWFVIAPETGIELQTSASAKALIAELAGPLHATLVSHANGVWAFRWRPPPRVHAVAVPDGSGQLAAWVGTGAAGRPILTGREEDWHVTSTGRAGYVADRLEWLRPAGRYQAVVRMSAAGPVNVEVWNNTSDTLLARRSLAATGGVTPVTLTVNASTPSRARTFSGWGPFRADFVPPPAGERLEVRVWSPGGPRVNVYSAQLTRAPSAQLP